MKKAISLFVAIASLGSAILFFAGCEATPEESTIPWSRPKDWEGGVPGLGNR